MTPFNYMPLWYMLIRRPLAYLQTLIGVNIFSFNQPKRDKFPLRLAISVAVSFAVCYLAAKYFYSPVYTSILDSFLRAFTQLVQFVAVFLSVWFCYKITVWSALMLTSAGYCAQTIAGGIKSLCMFIPLLSENVQGIWMIAVDIIIYIGTYYILYLIFRRFILSAGDVDDKQKALFSILVLFMSVMTGRLNQDVQEITIVSGVAQAVFSMLTSVLVLIIQFGAMERTKLREDVDSMRELVHEQHEQYRHSKQSVELVNEKYHDLKSLLEGFHGEISREQIDTLKARVGEYDTHIETGNHVLDIVLSEKRAVAAARKIDFTSFVDGKGLDFIEELDLYSLVGNALNNAIDAVSKLPEGERFITMTLRAEGGVVTMHVENPYGGDVVMENELPKTQRDERYHGFGMKSMERICEKYDGTLAVKAEGGIFSLDAVLLEP